MGRLEGKVALVTGAGSSGPGVGTGKAISVLFAREGAKVVLVDFFEDRAAETLALIEAEGGEATVVRADVTKSEDCKAAVDTAVERYGGLGILVNNVGVTRPGGIADIAEDEWDALIAVNLTSMMLMSKHAIPALKQAAPSAIVNIASTGATRPPGGHAAYDTAKGGVISLTIGLAVEHGRDGIRANCVQPGRIETPLVQVLAKDHPQDEEKRLRNRRFNLLGTIGDAWDVAWASLYLASDEARWVTAVTLPVEGGFLHTPPERLLDP